MPKNNPIIVALDVSSPLKALYLVGNLKVTGVAFKVGLELFLSGGPKIVQRIVNHHVRVFLDLKFYDIPHTVMRAVFAATRMGVWMLNVYAGGGHEMMKRAKEASLEAALHEKIPPPVLLGVTVLTSLSDLGEQNISKTVGEQVLFLARSSSRAGLDGVVASGHEVREIRRKIGRDFCVVTPGIRPADELQISDDQKRIMTPKQALKAGSNYLVIGRPVLESKRPIKTIEKILDSLV